MTRRGAAALALMLVLEPSCRSAAPAAPRPPYLRDPREGLKGPFPQGVAAGWRKLEAGDFDGAGRLFDRLAHDPAGAVGRVECALMRGRLTQAQDLCAEAMERGLDTAPLLAACGEVEARLEDRGEAFNLFEGAALRAPDSPELARLRDEAAPPAAEEWLDRALSLRLAGETADARQAAERALAIEPSNGEALRLAGETALEEKDLETAFRRLSAAWQAQPHNLELGEEAGETALRTERFETASRIFEALSADDRRFRERKREADEEFLISNWPAPERGAAHAARLTRAQAALLVWRLVPQVRWAPARGPAPVASDIVAREDRKILSRCLQLGLLSIDEATHRARPDAALRRSEEVRILERVSALSGARGGVPEKFVPTSRTGPVGGADFRRALRALRAEGREK